MANLILVKSHSHARAIKDREIFLAKHPELWPLQRKIDESLYKARTTHNRLVVIHDLMMEKASELFEKLQSIRKAVS